MPPNIVIIVSMRNKVDIYSEDILHTRSEVDSNTLPKTVWTTFHGESTETEEDISEFAYFWEDEEAGDLEEEWGGNTEVEARAMLGPEAQPLGNR